MEDNPVDASNKLNSDLSKIHQRATQWFVTFKPTKSDSNLFTRKQNKQPHPPIVMDHRIVNDVITHKHLGVIFSNDCTWYDHLEYVKSKAWSPINVMRTLKFKLDKKSLEMVHFSFIIPLLEYADIVWDNCTQSEASELEKIQIEAVRIVTGATKLSSINSLLFETGWEPFASRRWKHKLIKFCKMQNDLSPDHLPRLVPPTVGNDTAYQLVMLQTYRLDTKIHSCIITPSCHL